MMEELEDRSALTLTQRVFAKSCETVNSTVEYLASLSLGQMILRQTDKCLWTVEECAKWSVPQSTPPKHSATNGGAFGQPGPLVRPLPWFFFLPMLMVLRCTRFTVNLGATIMGMETVKPVGVVRFLQTRRRRVRALKFRGLRRIRQRKICQKNRETMNVSWKNRIYNILSKAACYTKIQNDVYEEITVQNNTEEAHTSNDISKSKSKNLKRKYIDLLEHNYLEWENLDDDEELIEKIKQYTDEDTIEDDPDYLPDEDENSSSAEDSMSDAEEDTQRPVLQRPASHGSLTQEIIEEENEDDHEVVEEANESSTVSANSEDESSQQIERSPEKSDQTPTKNNVKEVPTIRLNSTDLINAEKTQEPSEHTQKSKSSLDEEQVTTDPFYSPSSQTSEQSDELVATKNNHRGDNNTAPLSTIATLSNNKQDSENLINSEKTQVTVTVKNNQSASSKLPIATSNASATTATINHNSSSLPATANENNGTPTTRANSNHNTPRSHGKKHKHRRRLSNLLRRKRK